MKKILHVIMVNKKESYAYDIDKAYEENEEIPFSKDKNLGKLNAEKGDIVYLYLSKPVGKVMYKCIVSDDNMDVTKALDDSKYYISNKYVKEIKPNASSTCYMLKKLEKIDSKELDFDSIKKSMGEKGEKLSSFRGFTDQNCDHLVAAFNYIESIFNKENS